MRATCLGLSALVAILLSAAAPAAADTFETSIVIKDHLFQPTEVEVPAGVRIVLTVDNQDPTPEEFESNELKVEKVIPGKLKGKVSFGPLQPGTYPFFGDFNQATAQGVLTAK
jgi:hypothetical protein